MENLFSKAAVDDQLQILWFFNDPKGQYGMAFKRVCLPEITDLQILGQGHVLYLLISF